MTIRLGIISFAHMHAYSYADCITQLEGVELAGVFDEDENRANEAAKQFHTQAFTDCGALLQQDIQGVVICTENIHHKKYTLMAADAQKHILCEKPIATNIADANEMIDHCKQQGVQLMIAFPCRYSTVINRVHFIVSKGKLGNIFGMAGTNRGTMPGGWFIQTELSGGGAVLDHTVHVVDVWRWMLGKEVVSVYAEAAQNFYSDIHVEDTGLLSLEFEGGTFATLDTSWSRPNASFPTWGDVTMEITGDQGSISVDAFKQHVAIYNNKTVKAEWASWTDNIDLGLIRSFTKMIREGKEAPVTGYDGLKAMEVALGAYRSIETGEPVSLPFSS